MIQTAFNIFKMRKNIKTQLRKTLQFKSFFRSFGMYYWGEFVTISTKSKLYFFITDQCISI